MRRCSVLRLVVDTNVIVSALLKEQSVPAAALQAILSTAELLYDAHVLAEYAEVLQRPKFGAVDRARVAALLERLRQVGTVVTHDLSRSFAGALRDASDACFVDVALAGRADAIVTGNIKDFPSDLGFEVLPPATILARLT